MIDHVAVLVRSVERAAETLAGLGVGDIGAKDVFPGEGTAEIYVGDPGRGARLLLMEAIGPGPYQRALERRGPGLHHVALVADPIEEVIERGLAAGWRLEKTGKVRWLVCSGLPLVELTPRGATAAPLVTSLAYPLPAGAAARLSALGLESYLLQAAAEAGLVLEGRRIPIGDLG